MFVENEIARQRPYFLPCLNLTVSQISLGLIAVIFFIFLSMVTPQLVFLWAELGYGKSFHLYKVEWVRL